MKLKLVLALLAGLVVAPAVAQVVQVAPIPQGAQIAVVTSSTTGTTGSVNAGILGAANKWTYVCGFTVTSGGTTSATTGTAQLSGTTSSNMNFTYVYPAAGAQGVLGVAFPGCIAARAINTPIYVSVTAGGAGTAVNVNLWGYRN